MIAKIVDIVTYSTSYKYFPEVNLQPYNDFVTVTLEISFDPTSVETKRTTISLPLVKATRQNILDKAGEHLALIYEHYQRSMEFSAVRGELIGKKVEPWKYG